MISNLKLPVVMAIAVVAVNAQFEPPGLPLPPPPSFSNFSGFGPLPGPVELYPERAPIVSGISLSLSSFSYYCLYYCL